MNRLMCALVVVACFTVADARRSSAWVMFEPVRKGEVPWMVANKELRAALLKVRPLGGYAVSGSRNNCTLYYRGTEQSLQTLLDTLEQIENLSISCTIAKADGVGRVESSKFMPLPQKTLVYQFSVSISSMLGQRGVETARIVIHKSAGIDPEKLRLPESRKTKPYKAPQPVIEPTPITVLPKLELPELPGP